MGKKTTITCDVCGGEIEALDHFIKLNPNYLYEMSDGSRREYADSNEWYICRKCLNEIGRQVAERNGVEVNIEINKGKGK